MPLVPVVRRRYDAMHERCFPPRRDAHRLPGGLPRARPYNNQSKRQSVTEDAHMQVSPIQESFGREVSPDPGETPLDLDREALKDLFRQYGALVFRGFKSTLEEFDHFAAQFGGEFMTYRGGGYIRKQVGDGSDKTLLSVSYDHGRQKQQTFGLPLHGEMYYMDGRPDMLWFYCARPAESEGETTVCDGAAVYRELSPATKALLANKRLKFMRTYRDGEWQKIYQTDDMKEAEAFCRGNGLTVRLDEVNKIVRTEYVIPAVITSRWGGHEVYINNILPVIWQEREKKRGDTSIVRFEDGSELPDSLIEEVVGIQQRLLHKIAWDAGDFAMLDNSRTLHGRNAFTDQDREIYLRMVRNIDY
jgi:alpha-ketoglutarate-dependent taurine dioxygenase